jgi:phosphoribosylformylglycinamidine synthase
MSLLHLYRSPGLSPAQSQALLEKVRHHGQEAIIAIESEHCFNIETSAELTSAELVVLSWLLRETFEPDRFGTDSFLDAAAGDLLEVGPRMSFTTAWSTNAVAICHACGLGKIRRIERSRRYLVMAAGRLTETEQTAFLAEVHDRMTECRYPRPLTSFATGITPQQELNKEMGLAFDDWDLDYYTRLFRDEIGRNPTDVECFDIAQSNSEHSRHWFFKGRLTIEGEQVPKHLIDLIREPLEANPNNSIIAFNDNSSAIRGYPVRTLLPLHVGEPSRLAETDREVHIIFTAETHNFPSGVAPFPGAETGTGGRIRDTHATGRGSLVGAGTAAYCVGNLRIPGYQLPWEDPELVYPGNLASPLEIEIEASNGASAYGNKFGEPVIQGFTRSFGLRLPDGERREWIKPIMFSGGIGQIYGGHTEKQKPEPDMWVVKVGGPAYRIGMGGGAASSMVQGENPDELDFDAVQRGDAEMEQKVNRVIRACCEFGADNPIVSIHDQGAGGNCNVLKEIVEPAGARIEVRKIPVGDDTLSVLEIWGAEYQENDALLLRGEHVDLFSRLCEREKVPVAYVGQVTGDGRVQVHDSDDGTTPVDLSLDHVLGDMPQKQYQLQRVEPQLAPLSLPPDLTVRDALDRVLRLLAVGSKRFLTTKVDRAVTGLVACQPCAGPLQLTVADVAVVAQSHFSTTGAATAIGEQPIKGLVDPAAMARLSVGEALTNLVWARVSALEDVRCSANWMWAAKLPGEGAALYDAARAMRDLMVDLGIAVDGGKDSISMAALAPDGETVKGPGTLAISAYVTCPDIRSTVTPDLKLAGCSCLLYLDLGGGCYRLAGSALAQVYGQIGDQTPDLEDADLLKRAFNAVQELIADGRISAGHDRSDGGLLTTALEMAFAGSCGLALDIPAPDGTDPLAVLFAEELGLVLEVADDQVEVVQEVFRSAEVDCAAIGKTSPEPGVEVRVNGSLLLSDDVRDLRDLWEATSFALDRLQADSGLVGEEQSGLRHRTGPSYGLTFTPRATAPAILTSPTKIPVAILREEGSNSDREMAAAFAMAGFEPWDVTMSDLLAARIELNRFRGLAAVGGFSYADVLDSGKGWAGVIRFNDRVRQQFEAFVARQDTFSLGICNGCQLLALLGWVPWQGAEDLQQPRFIHNASGRFESRFTTVRIQESPSILLRGMAGSTMGIWLQHGEGRAHFPDDSVLQQVLDEELAPVRYVDDAGRITEAYPFNPNGSAYGIAALTSKDGRHLAIMPHPDRTFLKWQWAWMPEAWKRDLEVSPWLQLFQNAYRWCAG